MNVKIKALSIATLLVISCYGMNNPQNDMSNAKVCKEQFFNWWKNTPLATEERWECMRKGFEQKGGSGITLIPLKQCPESTNFCYVACPCPVEIKNGKAIFFYPWSACSPNVKTKLDDLCPGIKSAYCLAPKDSFVLESVGWKKVDSLPEALEPKYFGPYDTAEIVPFKLKLKLWGEKTIEGGQKGEELEKDGDIINWDIARLQFSMAWGDTLVGTQERWELMKKGLTGFDTKVTLIPSNPIVTPPGEQYLVGDPTTRYLVYARPQEVDGELAIFVYPSSLGDFISAVLNLCPDIKKAYSLAPKHCASYNEYGWEKIDALPEAMKPEFFGEYDAQAIVPWMIKFEACKKIMTIAKDTLNSNQMLKEESRSGGFCITH